MQSPRCCRWTTTCIIFKLLVIALPTQAELTVENSQELEYLVDGMRASQNKIIDVRATLKSHKRFEAPGQPVQENHISTEWLSIGNRFRYATNWEVLVDGNPPPFPEPGDERVLQPKRFYQRAYNGEVFVEYRPEEERAQVRDFQGAMASINTERAQQEPLIFGLSVFGASLEEIVQGKSWRSRPEDWGGSATRVVRYGGTREYEGRQVHVIEMIAKWTSEKSGEPRARYYEIYVDSNRGFTIPYACLSYQREGHEREQSEIIETECVQYPDGFWGPKKTVYTMIGTGKSMLQVTITEIERMQFNTGVTEDELRVVIPSGTDIDDQVAGVLYRYQAGGEEAEMDLIFKVLEDAGFYKDLDKADNVGQKSPAVVPNLDLTSASATASATAEQEPPRRVPGIVAILAVALCLVLCIWFFGRRATTSMKEL